MPPAVGLRRGAAAGLAHTNEEELVDERAEAESRRPSGGWVYITLLAGLAQVGAAVVLAMRAIADGAWIVLTLTIALFLMGVWTLRRFLTQWRAAARVARRE